MAFAACRVFDETLLCAEWFYIIKGRRTYSGKWETERNMSETLEEWQKNLHQHKRQSTAKMANTASWDLQKLEGFTTLQGGVLNNRTRQNTTTYWVLVRMMSLWHFNLTDLHPFFHNLSLKDTLGRHKWAKRKGNRKTHSIHTVIKELEVWIPDRTNFQEQSCYKKRK